MKPIYFDNGATSYPKAPGVAQAVVDYIENVGANIGRGTYQRTYAAGSVLQQTRERIAQLFHYENEMNVVFTSNITHSLNLLIKGLLNRGDHVLVSSMEHNAVMRPLFSMCENGIEFDRVQCNLDGTLDPSLLEKQIKPNTRLVLMTHASNVCGTLLPIEQIGKICSDKGIFFVIDAAQTAGVMELDFHKLHLNGLAFTGHKGLLGPQGIGGLVLDDTLAVSIRPYIEGGTGSRSESEHQPDFMPDKFESGTLNLPGIYGLHASLGYLNTKGLDQILAHELLLTDSFLQLAQELPGTRIIGLTGVQNRTSVVSLDFTSSAMDNSEVAFQLDTEYNIMTRVGLHCAPSAHKTLGTFPQGTVRFSFGQFNTLEQIDYCINALQKILR